MPAGPDGRRRAPGRHYQGAPGGGRGEAPAQGRPGRRVQPPGREPGRGPPDGDRQRARHEVSRGGEGVPDQAPHHPEVHRGQHGQHGGGQLPLRREHLAEAFRFGGAGHQGRSEEHEQLQVGLRRPRLRGGEAGEGPRRRRERGTGDSRLGGGQGCDGVAAVEGVRLRLQVLPRTRSAAAVHRTVVDRRGAGQAAGAAGSKGRAVRPGIWNPADVAGVLTASRSTSDFFESVLAAGDAEGPALQSLPRPRPTG